MCGFCMLCRLSVPWCSLRLIVWLYQKSWYVATFWLVSKALLISSATVIIVRARRTVWLNPFAVFSTCRYCCLLTPLTLDSGGEFDLPACGPPSSFSVHLASSSVTSGGVCPQIQGWQRGTFAGAVEEMMCVVCVCVLQRGNCGEGYDLASTLCKYDLRKAGKCLFRATNVWWRCAQYCVIASCD